MTEPIMNFSDVPDAAGAPEATRRRGRPRSQETIARDEQVLTVLRDGGVQSKDQLVATLGLEPKLVYLSLWRLKREQRVERVSLPDVRHAWRVSE